MEERLPGMGKVAGSNPADTHLRFFVSAVGAIGVATLKLQYDYIGGTLLGGRLPDPEDPQITPRTATERHWKMEIRHVLETWVCKGGHTNDH